MTHEHDEPAETVEYDYSEERADDPMATLFVVGLMLLLLLCVVIVLIGNARKPAGL
jgi:hypothetical protein